MTILRTRVSEFRKAVSEYFKPKKRTPELILPMYASLEEAVGQRFLHISLNQDGQWCVTNFGVKLAPAQHLWRAGPSKAKFFKTKKSYTRVIGNTPKIIAYLNDHMKKIEPRLTIDNVADAHNFKKALGITERTFIPEHLRAHAFFVTDQSSVSHGQRTQDTMKQAAKSLFCTVGRSAQAAVSALPRIIQPLSAFLPRV